MGIAAEVVLVEAHQLDHFQRPGVELVLAGNQLIDEQALADDLLNGHTGIQGGDRVLEDHLNLLMDHPLVLRGELTGNQLALEIHLAPRRLVQPDNRPPSGGLAAGGLSHQTEGLAPGNLEADVVHGLDHDLVFANAVFKVLLQMLYVQHNVLLFPISHVPSPPFASDCWRSAAPGPWAALPWAQRGGASRWPRSGCRSP